MTHEPLNLDSSGVSFKVTFEEKSTYDWGFDGTVCWGEESDNREAFKFIFCWRGVWESRIYFSQEEYWGEELSEMNAVWKDIEDELRRRIIMEHPEYKHFD